MDNRRKRKSNNSGSWFFLDTTRCCAGEAKNQENGTCRRRRPSRFLREAHPKFRPCLVAGTIFAARIPGNGDGPKGQKRPVVNASVWGGPDGKKFPGVGRCGRSSLFFGKKSDNPDTAPAVEPRQVAVSVPTTKFDLANLTPLTSTWNACSFSVFFATLQEYMVSSRDAQRLGKTVKTSLPSFGPNQCPFSARYTKTKEGREVENRGGVEGVTTKIKNKNWAFQWDRSECKSLCKNLLVCGNTQNKVKEK